MTEKDAASIVKLIDANWPHQRMRPETFALFFDLLGDRDAQAVQGVVRAFIVDGREFPPTPGMILKRLADTVEPELEWDEAQAEILAMIIRFGSYRQPPASEWSHPLLARFMAMGARWREWCLSEEGDRTFRAQERNAFHAMTARAGRERTLLLAGTSSGQIRSAGRAIAQLVESLEPNGRT